MDMRKYWFSILLTLFIAASIGTFYVRAATRDLPDYQLQTVEGDASEAENLALDGVSSFNDETNHLVIDRHGSHYAQKKSMIAQMLEPQYTNRNPDLASLMEEHKSFMRGKLNSGGFYADENQLVYAIVNRVSNYSTEGLESFSISMYTQDLKSGKKKHFDAILPANQKFSNFFIYDVQAVDNQIKIMVYLSKEKLNPREGNMKSEIHLYTVDADKEGIVDDQTIVADKALDGGKVEHYALQEANANIASPSNYALILKTTMQAKDSNGYKIEQPIGLDISVYSYRTAKLMPVPGDSKGDNPKDSYLNGNSLITLWMNGGQVHVRSSELAKESVSQFDIPLSLKGGDLSKMQKIVYDDRLYLFNRVEGENELLIADLSAGQVVYQGKLTVNGTAEQQKERLYRLKIYNFYLAE